MAFKILLMLTLVVVLLSCIHAREVRNAIKNPPKRTTVHDNVEFEPVFVKSISCSYDPQYIRDVKCFLHSNNRTHKRLFLTFYTINEENNILVRLKHSIKKQNNIYAPGYYDMTLKLCDFVNNLKNDVPSLQKVLLDKFAPHWQKLYGHLFHPCPYQGLVTVNQSITGTPKNWNFADFYPSFTAVPTKWETKIEISLFSGDRMQKPAFAFVVRNSNY